MNASSNGNPHEPGDTRLAQYVTERLPDDYLFQNTDIKWLDFCNEFLQGEPTNVSVVAATKAALKACPTGHIDPFELLIDAQICDTKCEPLPPQS